MSQPQPTPGGIATSPIPLLKGATIDGMAAYLAPVDETQRGLEAFWARLAHDLETSGALSRRVFPGGVGRQALSGRRRRDVRPRNELLHDHGAHERRAQPKTRSSKIVQQDTSSVEKLSVIEQFSEAA